MELLTVPPPNNSHHFRSSEVTSPFGGDSHPVQGSSHQVPYIALEGGVLDQKDTDLIDLGPTFQEYISDVTASASAPFRQPSCDENTNPYAGRGHISTDTLGLNEAIPHSAFGDSCRDLGYDADPYNGEGDHHYSCDCSSCGTVCYNVDLGKTRNFEPLAAPASQYAGELVASQGFDPPSPETEPRSASGPPFPTVYLPMVQQLSNSTDILRLLKRCVGGRAVCLWMHEGGECGFSSQIDLVKRHIKRVHLRLRPCACEYCGRRFFNNYALSLHYNTHTGAKPYICNFCGRCFATPSGKSHHRVHIHGYRVPRRHTLVAGSFPGAEYGHRQEELNL